MAQLSNHMIMRHMCEYSSHNRGFTIILWQCNGGVASAMTSPECPTPFHCLLFEHLLPVSRSIAAELLVISLCSDLHISEKKKRILFKHVDSGGFFFFSAWRLSKQSGFPLVQLSRYIRPSSRLRFPSSIHRYVICLPTHVL